MFSQAFVCSQGGGVARGVVWPGVYVTRAGVTRGSVYNQGGVCVCDR